MPTPTVPSVGRVVHYVSYGTPGGEYTKQCRAATVSEVPADENSRSVVGLVVLNPTGLFFHSLGAGGCPYDDAQEPRGGTWHWPERV
jgi:hypothetical protein